MPDPAPRRIVVLGCAGSGKTTFARRLGARTGFPVICLDEIWQPSWTDQDVPRFRALLSAAHLADAWISDGNFALATFDIRLPRADLIVWLECPRIVCAWRAVRRLFAAGEAHKLRNLPKVLGYIRRFERVNRQLIERTLAEHGPSVRRVRLAGARAVKAFVCSLT